jgi:CRP-like cAMP-binding protein
LESPVDDYAILRQTLQRIAHLPDEEFEYLRQQAESRSYPAGHALIQIGEAPSRCWFLISGFLRFFYVTESGREYNKAFSRPGEIVMPLTAALAGAPNSFVIAAATDARTLAFPVSLIPALYDRQPWRTGNRHPTPRAARRVARPSKRDLVASGGLMRWAFGLMRPGSLRPRPGSRSVPAARD